MSRNRLYVVVAVLVLFIVAGGVLIYATRSHGGQNVTINLTVTGASKMTPDNPTANQNDKVTINVTSDTEGEVHLHGYDIHFAAMPGQTVTHTFTADKTGTFEIEWETTSTHLGNLVVS
jgi:heme/copper-type cytochrome/quinol oxidase subunit 2